MSKITVLFDEFDELLARPSTARIGISKETLVNFVKDACAAHLPQDEAAFEFKRRLMNVRRPKYTKGKVWTVAAVVYTVREVYEATAEESSQ